MEVGIRTRRPLASRDILGIDVGWSITVESNLLLDWGFRQLGLNISLYNNEQVRKRYYPKTEEGEVASFLAQLKVKAWI